MDESSDFAVVGESADTTLREHEIAVGHDLEDTVLAFNQLDGAPELGLQLGRQPGGPRLVVSNSAVFD
jgi:hypothetical protein